MVCFAVCFLVYFRVYFLCVPYQNILFSVNICLGALKVSISNSLTFLSSLFSSLFSRVNCEGLLFLSLFRALYVDQSTGWLARIKFGARRC
jgi:hypothetical protein